MKQFLVFLEQKFILLKKYKMKNLFWSLIIFPLSIIIDIILRQEYIKLVPFYEKYIPYFYILFVGSIIIDIFDWIIPWITREFLNPDFIRNFHIFNKVQYFLSIIIYVILMFLIKTAIIYLPFYIIFKLHIKFYILAILGVILLVPFSLSLALFFTTFILRYKEDAEPLWWGFNTFAWVIFPVSFSLVIFPEPIRTYLEIFIPSFAIIEEIRKLAILGNFNFSVLSLSILISFVYLLFSIFLFRYVYDKGRKGGWIYLR